MQKALEKAIEELVSTLRSQEKQKTEEANAQAHSNQTDASTQVEFCKKPNFQVYEEVAAATYQPPNRRPQIVGKMWVKDRSFQTKTVAVYHHYHHKSVVIGYRGTEGRDLGDLRADRMIMFNRLRDTQRFQADLSTTQKILDQYTGYCIYTCGHSLGNAIQLQIDRTLGHPFKGGVGFNGALQPKDLVQTPKNYRFFYIKNDPLYSLMGRKLKKGLVVFPQQYQKALPNHSITNFASLSPSDALRQGKKGGKKLPYKNELKKFGFVQTHDKANSFDYPPHVFDSLVREGCECE